MTKKLTVISLQFTVRGERIGRIRRIGQIGRTGDKSQGLYTREQEIYRDMEKGICYNDQIVFVRRTERECGEKGMHTRM